MVSDLREEPYDPVLLFKPQGEHDPKLPKIPADGFILGIQMQFQKELYEKYGHNILCIDATHGTMPIILCSSHVSCQMNMENVKKCHI